MLSSDHAAQTLLTWFVFVLPRIWAGDMSTEMASVRQDRDFGNAENGLRLPLIHLV